MLKESIFFVFFLLEWGLFLCFECCVVVIRQQHYWQVVSSCRGRFIVPVYTCSPHIRKTLGHICNPFETHLCNVRNVFVICVLHIRRVKVWFLRCKSMVFGVQKGGFYIAKVWFLACKKGVFALQKGGFYTPKTPFLFFVSITNTLLMCYEYSVKWLLTVCDNAANGLQ